MFITYPPLIRSFNQETRKKSAKEIKSLVVLLSVPFNDTIGSLLHGYNYIFWRFLFVTKDKAFLGLIVDDNFGQKKSVLLC